MSRDSLDNLVPPHVTFGNPLPPPSQSDTLSLNCTIRFAHKNKVPLKLIFNIKTVNRGLITKTWTAGVASYFRLFKQVLKNILFSIVCKVVLNEQKHLWSRITHLKSLITRAIFCTITKIEIKPYFWKSVVIEHFTYAEEDA